MLEGNVWLAYHADMSTLAEIELAARRLSSAERQQLLILVAQSLRAEGQRLPQPRIFTAGEMQAWMDEDERDLQQFRERD